MKQSWWRKLFEPLSASVRRSRPDETAENRSLSRLDTATVQGLVQMIFSTHPDELDCNGCFEHVDRFAELVLAGKDAAEAMPLVQDHLDRCRCCREEFEALLMALEAIA
jgi:hypothetical protein